MSTYSIWLGLHGDEQVDRDVWCLVPAGDPMLTRRANTCDGRDLMETDGRYISQIGRYVRHADLAAALATGSPAVLRRTADRLAFSAVTYQDAAAVALTAPVALAAPLLACLRRQPESTWREGAARAIATGADPRAVKQRLRLALRLSTVTSEHLAGWLTLLAVTPNRTIRYVRAGLTPAEAAEIERSGKHDPEPLGTLAALRGAA